MQHDVFISHASEDKAAIARPLAEELRKRGYAVWFDAFELRLGDSLSRSIDKGLASSRFGIVILSKHFFAKRWPERELAGLIARETHSGDKTVLPIWHQVSQDEVLRYSPALADKLALSTTSEIDEIADQVADAIGLPLTAAVAPRYDLYLGYDPADGISNARELIMNLRGRGLTVYDWMSHAGEPLASQLPRLAKECKLAAYLFLPSDGSGVRGILTMEVGMFAAALGADHVCVIRTDPHGGPLGIVGPAIFQVPLERAADCIVDWARGAA